MKGAYQEAAQGVFPPQINPIGCTQQPSGILSLREKEDNVCPCSDACFSETGGRQGVHGRKFGRQRIRTANGGGQDEKACTHYLYRRNDRYGQDGLRLRASGGGISYPAEYAAGAEASGHALVGGGGHESAPGLVQHHRSARTPWPIPPPRFPSCCAKTESL